MTTQLQQDQGEAKADRQRPSDMRFFLATVLLWSVVAAFLFVGIDYVTSVQPKPFHLEFFDTPFNELSPGLRELILTLLKGTGMVALVTALSLSVLLIIPFRRRENWSRWALLTISGFTLIPTLAKALEERLLNGTHVPWWPHVVMGAAVLVAVWLTRDFAGKSDDG